MYSFVSASPTHLVGSIEYTLDGRGPGFKFDQALYFLRGKLSSKKLLAYDLSADVLSAYLINLRSDFFVL